MSTLLRVFPEKQSLPSISNCFQDQVGEKSCFSLKIRVASRGEGCQTVLPVHWGVSIAGIKRDHFSPKTATPPTDSMSYLSFLLTRCYNMLITFDFQKTLSWDIPNMSKNQSVASKLFSCPTFIARNDDTPYHLSPPAGLEGTKTQSHQMHCITLPKAEPPCLQISPYIKQEE